MVAGVRTAGLDIGSSAVRAAEIVVSDGEVRLERFGQVALPDGAVLDGEIAQADVVADAVKELWAATRIRTRRVAVGVANKRVVVRQVELPWLPADEMRVALRYQVQDFLPMAVEDAVLDYHVLEEFVGDGGARMLRGLLVAADSAMVMQTLTVATAARLRVDVVDLTPFALLRAVSVLGAPVSGGDHPPVEAIVDIGAAVTNIVVHAAGRPRFVRLLMLGGGDVTEALADHLGLPVEEAELRKRQLAMQGVVEPIPSATPDPAGRAVEFAASSFLDEVRGSLDYYRAQAGAQPLSRIVVTGGGSRLGNLLERLAAATRLPVHRGSGIGALDAHRTGLDPAQIDEVDAVSSVPIGLAMRLAA